MQQAPVLKGSGLAPVEDEPAHVFGKNLEARVVATHEDDDNEADLKDNKKYDDDEDIANIKKRKFETITGEENEETVFQGEFKLFVWDVSSSNWIEKGRGQLKLNDDLNEKRSRLIMRIGGTFRIILNVAIRHSLFKVISTSKTSVRFSDCQNVWAASGSNAKELGDLLNERIAAATKRVRESSPTTKEIKDTENKHMKVSKESDDTAASEGRNEKATKEEHVESEPRKEGHETVAGEEGEENVARKEPEGQEQEENESDDPPNSKEDEKKQSPHKKDSEETLSTEGEEK